MCNRNGTWRTLSPLLNNRYGHIAVSYCNVFSVYSGVNRTNCEYYTILTDQWSVINNALHTGFNYINYVIDVNKRLLYTNEDANVYSISLENNSKYLLHNNVYCHCLVIMHNYIPYVIK